MLPNANLNLKKKYLNMPVKNEAPECLISLEVEGQKMREFSINLAPAEPDYWVYLEIKEFAGKKGKLIGKELPKSQMKGFQAVFQADTFPGEDKLYKEELRPQFHFSSKRGWLNDPVGLMYYAGEYHLFYQHNPYGWKWGNMTWGHAVSKDLIHWEELGDAIHPDELGMIFSGSGVVDWKNTTGFQTGDEPPLICIYTSAGDVDGLHAWSKGKPFTQSLAYSNDRGRTWTKYEGNPVQGHLNKDNRDTKVIWWEETNEWVLVLFTIDERMAFFRSPDLKRWELQGLLKSFHECPELFQLAVDGDENNKKWIHHGGSGDYLIGDFDGSKFTPQSGPIKYSYGNRFYASQTFSDIPEEDGRRIQIGWGDEVQMPGMPFNQMLLFPTSLTLHTTDEGLRMFPYPVREIEKLHGRKYQWKDEELAPGDNPLENLEGNLFDINVEIALNDAEVVGFELNGFPMSYNVKDKLLTAGEGVDTYHGNRPEERSAPLAPVDGKISFRILVDRTFVEIFANKGRVYMPMQAVRDLDDKTLDIYVRGGSANIEELTIYEMNSIWP
ncbi:MAG: GH32 C-terminal domain-containing protein [Planctomycetota bacterium]